MYKSNEIKPVDDFVIKRLRKRWTFLFRCWLRQSSYSGITEDG
jgi:hypothetical protein